MGKGPSFAARMPSEPNTVKLTLTFSNADNSRKPISASSLQLRFIFLGLSWIQDACPETLSSKERSRAFFLIHLWSSAPVAWHPAPPPHPSRVTVDPLSCTFEGRAGEGGGDSSSFIGTTLRYANYKSQKKRGGRLETRSAAGQERCQMLFYRRQKAGKKKKKKKVVGVSAAGEQCVATMRSTAP